MAETNRIEHKRELTKDLDIEKEVIAFLNYHEGGIIYIGIDKDGSIAGVENVDSDMLKIKDRLKNNIQRPAQGYLMSGQRKEPRKTWSRSLLPVGRRNHISRENMA